MLDDDVMMQLGNALLLGYCVEILKRRHWPEKDLVRERDRAEAGDRRDLDEALEFAGGLHPSLSSFADELSGNLTRIDEVHAQWEALATSDDPIARLSLKDINFGDLDDAHPVSRELELARPNELRTPICQLGPTRLTREIARLVILYCHEVDEIELAAEGLKRPEPKKRRRNVNDVYFERSLQEALKLVDEDGHPPKPYSLAGLVVRKHGHVTIDKWTKKSKKVPGHSPASAKQNLARRLDKVLKERQKSGS